MARARRSRAPGRHTATPVTWEWVARLRGAGLGGASTAAGPKASRRALPDGSHAVWIDTSNAASSSRVHPGWCSGTSNASGGIRRVVVWAGFVLLAAPLLAGRSLRDV